MTTKLIAAWTAVLALTACGDGVSESYDADFGPRGGPEHVPTPYSGTASAKDPQMGSSGPAPGNSQVKLHSVYDAQAGMVSLKMPLPANWKINSQPGANAPTITGPNGLQVYDFPPQSFMNVADPQMRQAYAQSGQQLRAMPDINTIIQQDLVPWAKQQGLTFEARYELPEVTRKDTWYQQQLFQAMPSQRQFAAIGTEWKNGQGDKFFLLVHLGQSVGNGMETWFYYCNGLQAEPSYFEEAKQHLIYGYANVQYNPAHIQAYNQREAAKSQQSRAAHNQRMQNNQRAFQASQRAHVEASNSALDSSMASWRRRNDMQDRGHSNYIDSINETTTMVNPSSGQSWEVDAGANNYWMNNDGEYFTTDDYNYNPNVDPGMYDQEWQQMEEYEQ